MDRYSPRFGAGIDILRVVFLTAIVSFGGGYLLGNLSNSPRSVRYLDVDGDKKPDIVVKTLDGEREFLDRGGEYVRFEDELDRMRNIQGRHVADSFQKDVYAALRGR